MESGWGGGFGVAMLAGMGIGLLLTIVVGGALLALAVRWIGGFRPGYGRSCVVVLLALVLGLVVQVAFGFLLRATAGPLLAGLFGAGIAQSIVLALGGVVLLWLVMAVLVRVMLPGPDGSAMPLARALGAAAATVAAGLAIYLALLAVMVMLAGGLGGFR